VDCQSGVKLPPSGRASSRGQPVGRRAALRLIVKIEIAERRSVRVADDEALRVPFDHPRRQEAARGEHGAMIARAALLAVGSAAERSSGYAAGGRSVRARHP